MVVRESTTPGRSGSGKKRGLYLFSQDLRLDDNPALNGLIEQCDELLFLYIDDPVLYRNSHYGFSRLGDHRRLFIDQSLSDLHRHLQRFGHQLERISAEPAAIISRLCQTYQIDRVSGSFNSGLYEIRFWQKLNDQLHGQVMVLHQNSLLTPEQLPITLDKLPKQFTPFRKLAETQTVSQPVKLNTLLAQRRPIRLTDTGVHLTDTCSADLSLPISGGSEAAWNHLDHFIWKSRAIDHYKQTRNTLDIVQRPDHVSLLSGWLAQGCLSVRQVWWEISRYEQQFGENESSYWLKFELFWREFFYWNAHRLGPDLYRFAGERGKKPLTSFYSQRFKSWCEGTTSYPLVNACMKQLKTTGMLSNRGRQLVASALVNELQLDWRYGAAWFEHQLIDYDPGSNYGNWQYIAGVGADPRGGRHFNLQKQMELYDPDRSYTRRWQGEFAPPMDAVGIDDWPLFPPH